MAVIAMAYQEYKNDQAWLLYRLPPVLLFLVLNSVVLQLLPSHHQHHSDLLLLYLKPTLVAFIHFAKPCIYIITSTLFG